MPAASPLYLATAVEAVLKAGEIQLERLGTAIKIDFKGAIDLVTEVDLQVEDQVQRLIAARFPAHDLLAEERAGISRNASHRWVLDPIDGTVNYVHRLPIFCVSLSLEIDGQPEVAAVYDPTRRELYTAERGQGAFLNGRRLQVSPTPELGNSLTCTGFPYDVQERTEEILILFREFLKKSRAVRRLGSAALDMCYVAAGRFDGFWEQRLNPWDTSAATLIVREAGGVVTTFEGQEYRSSEPNVVASNGRIHPAMLSIIQAALREQLNLRARLE